jgi:peptidoglycan hydrolase CwlO-like protein
MFEIERLHSDIKELEYKYKEAFENHKSYSTLKRIKERIKELKERLRAIEFILTVKHLK